jgi:hypothetical protein
MICDGHDNDIIESKPEDTKDIGDSTRHAKRILEFIFRKLVDYKKLVPSPAFTLLHYYTIPFTVHVHVHHSFNQLCNGCEIGTRFAPTARNRSR